MDSKIIFSRTGKGEDEARSKTSHLSGDIKRALLMVDGTSAFGEISKRAAPSLRNTLEEMLRNLEKSGFIQDKFAQGKANVGNIPKMVVPLKKPVDNGVDELDFTTAFRAPSAEILAAEAKKAETAKLKMAVEAKTHAEAEAKAQREAEAAKQKTEQEAARVRAELEAAKAKAETEAKARALAEAKAKQQIEAARIKAEAEAKARAEAEARARAEAEAKARQEIEAAKLKVQQEAEAARLKAEREAAKAREEAELVKQKTLAEAKAREEAERHAREQAEAARVKAEQEAARVRAELEAAKAKAEAEAKTRAEAERRSREAAEAARIKAEQEAAQARTELEAAKAKAEAEAKSRAEAERRSRETAEAARVNAEQEAAQVRAELEAAKAKAEAEAKAREEVERHAREAAEAAKLKAQQEVDEARIKAEQEASTAHKEAELSKQKAETEIRAREETEQLAKEQAEAVAGLKAQQEPAKSRTEMSQAARSTSATVLFFDVVGYTKQPVNKQIEIKKQFNHLVSDCLAVQGDGERIILDTGDGAAIGFMQHPEDALEVAMQFREAVMANGHNDYPDLKVRIGIHLGPINVAKDMNGRSNMVGDGINDAQRVMSFAGIDQIYISRSYYDFVSRLSDEYANLFQYRGVQNDKHGREHPVYELVDAATPVVEIVPPQASEPAPAISLEPFSFVMPEAATASPAPETAHEKPEAKQQDEAALLKDIAQMNWAEETSKPAIAEPVAPQQMPSAPPPPSAPEAAPQQKPPAPPPSASAPETLETTTPKEAPKPVAQARMPSAEEVAKLAETQAKAWAEAEQRGVETAKAKAKADSIQQQRHTPSAAKNIPVERERRKPIPWGKLGAGLFVVVLAALFAVPPLLPMQGYATSIEQLLTARLQQPVHIGRMAGRILPMPRLDLSDVSVGETKQIQAKQARVNFALSALFSSNKIITGIELEGVQANGAALQQVSAWMQILAADTHYPVERIELSQGKLEADGVPISDIGGELSFNQAGKFAQAKLHADGGKFALDINATPENKMAVSVTVRGSALPLLPNWVFDELTARGELTGDELVITDLDGRLMGGMLLGDARISWRSGWRAQGSLVAKTIATQNMSRALSGDMEGKARFQMQSTSLSRLTEAAMLDGNFIVKKGVINGFDIVETARQRSRENLPGGRTHFDELSGELSFANDVYNFRQLKMNAGVLNATGTLEINKQQLSGRVAADLAKFAGMGVVALQVNGTSDNPTLRAAR